MDGIHTLRDREPTAASVNVDRIAEALPAWIRGGVSIMMSTGSSAHLKAALDTGIDRLRSTPADTHGAPGPGCPGGFSLPLRLICAPGISAVSRRRAGRSVPGRGSPTAR